MVCQRSRVSNENLVVSASYNPKIGRTRRSKIEWLDLATIRSAAGFETVEDHNGIPPEKDDKQVKMHCPFHEPVSDGLNLDVRSRHDQDKTFIPIAAGPVIKISLLFPAAFPVLLETPSETLDLLRLRA